MDADEKHSLTEFNRENSQRTIRDWCFNYPSCIIFRAHRVTKVSGFEMTLN